MFWVGDLGGNFHARPWEAAVLVSELVLLLVFSIFMMFTGWRWKRITVRDLWVKGDGLYENFVRGLFKNLIFLMDYLGSIFSLLAVLFRLLGDEDQELQFLANGALIVVIQVLV